MAALGAALAEGNPAPYSRGRPAPGPRRRGRVSASPERFLSRRGDLVTSSPIKGTAATADGFLDKDRAENVMIVDLVRNDLGRVCEWGSVAVPSLLSVEAHPGLFHLVSTVEGGCARARAGPTPSAPRSRRGRSPAHRRSPPSSPSHDSSRRLGASTAAPSDGSTPTPAPGDLNVAIRTFWIEHGSLHFGTGGGITYDSSPEGEWAETELKAANLLRVVSARDAHLPVG